VVLNSFLKWMGGKSRLSKEIVSLIPSHRTFVEPFGGAGWVLFGKPASNVEFLNDLDGGLVNLYLVVRDHLEEFLAYLDKTPISEAFFDSPSAFGIPDGYPRGKFDVRAAARTYFVVMNSFNGNIGHKPSFAVGPVKESAFVRFYSTDWDMVRERLKRVTILNRDFGRLFEAVDGPDTFYYLDPPYMCATENTRYYRYTFSEEDHGRLLVYLYQLEGKFILSYGDDPRIRELYSDFIIRPSSVEGELFILNYEPSEVPFYRSVDGIPKGSCSRGIPVSPGGRRAPFGVPNCPVCGGRDIQQLSKRVTLEGGSRNWVPEAYTCNSCSGLFRKTVEATV